MTELDNFYNSEFDDHAAVVAATKDACRDGFTHMLAGCVAAIRDGNKIMFFGNGGSAGDAQHLATELAVRYVKDRAPIAAIALTTDTSSLTAIGNDMGFDALFERQVQAIGKPGDIAIGISTSGKSENVNRALIAAKKMGIQPMGLSGRDGGAMIDLCDPCIIVPSQVTARIQEMHITLGQMLCGALEIELGLVSPSSD
ncbi:D-sedoheptulose 7-phosphate isomerase [Curvivirga aplysinae]|uniref:D-sedoheptulose 7-phosphate isomerase n=1 Tax=Curvivirga aplysinae TaxID=2529852 RepID=UPI0012BCE4D2|nr:D-sedoheptulose 7-phosphate isomerase [Curvivirga aplysinae]MTI11067.1 SIS domain-containing protein [Curvivirga aplysinae]